VLCDNRLSITVDPPTVKRVFTTVLCVFPTEKRVFPTVKSVFPTVKRVFTTAKRVFPTVKRVFSKGGLGKRKPVRGSEGDRK
jgi:hypothetical protein